MILVTGDTHGLHDFFKLKKLAEEGNLTRDDYVIIAGDFGGVWLEKTEIDSATGQKIATMDSTDLQLYKDLPFTVLFVDGNHENFNLLDAMPEEIWNGGKIHRVADNIFHLMRGQIYTICGKKFFTFGGGESIDKAWRVEGKSWWRREVPSYREYDEAHTNLALHDNKVDYVITHTTDEKSLYYPVMLKFFDTKPATATNKALTFFENKIEYEHWYFGHYHIDEKITPNKTAIYHNIIKLVD